MTIFDKKCIRLFCLLVIIDILTIVFVFINQNVSIALGMSHFILLFIGICYLKIYFEKKKKLFYLLCLTKGSDKENDLSQLFHSNNYDQFDVTIMKYNLYKYLNQPKKLKNKILKIYMYQSDIQYEFSNILESNDHKFKKKYAVIGFLVSILFLAFGIITYKINGEYVGLFILSIFRVVLFNTPLISRSRILQFFIEILG